jgi:hypothetical protein
MYPLMAMLKVSTRSPYNPNSEDNSSESTNPRLRLYTVTSESRRHDGAEEKIELVPVFYPVVHTGLRIQ